jgi:hypothetical protein
MQLKRGQNPRQPKLRGFFVESGCAGFLLDRAARVFCWIGLRGFLFSGLAT